MKTALTTIVSAIFLFLPITGFAGYIIHLKDGGKIVTDQYFEEGDQIKLKRYGGVIGIPKDRVLEIEKTESSVEPSSKADTPVHEEGKAEQGIATDAEKGEAGDEEAPPEEVVTGKQEGKDPKETEKSAVKEDKKLVEKYMKEFDGMKKKFQQLPVMKKEELRKFADELLSFRQRVLEDRLGRPFSEHLVEIYSMLDKVETTLKLRGH